MTSLPNLSLMGKEEENLVIAESSFRTRSPTTSEISSVTRFVNAQHRSTFFDNLNLSEEQLKRNLAVLSVSCALSFGALSTCQAIQSSLSPQSNLGIASFAGVYACAAVSSLIGPSVVHLLGINMSLLIGSVAGVTFIAAHLSPHLMTLTPSSLLLGLCFGPWLCARVSLLITIMNKYLNLTDQANRDKLLQKFFLFFNFALNSGDVVAHLITCLILTPGDDQVPRLSPSSIEGHRLACGSRADCVLNFTYTSSHLHTNHVSSEPYLLSRDSWIWLISAMTAGSVAGVILIGVGLDRIDVREQQDPLERPPALIYLKQVCRTFVDSKLVFALPLVFCAGFQHGLLLTDFTKFFVYCTLNISHVGWTILCSAVTQMCTGFIVPLLALHIPRVAILLAALSFQLGLLIVLWLWTPDADDVPVFYVIAGGWGICKAVWDTMAFPITAISFVDVWQAPIAVYDFAHTAGLATAFFVHKTVCCRVKIVVLLIIFPIVVLMFIILDARLQRFRKLRATTAFL